MRKRHLPGCVLSRSHGTHRAFEGKQGTENPEGQGREELEGKASGRETLIKIEWSRTGVTGGQGGGMTESCLPFYSFTFLPFQQLPASV